MNCLLTALFALTDALIVVGCLLDAAVFGILSHTVFPVLDFGMWCVDQWFGDN